MFPIYDNTGSLVTGAAGLDSEVSKDQGTFTDCTNEATEIATSSGIYYLDLTSTEMNADGVAVIVKTSTTNAKTTCLFFYPQESGDIKVDMQSWNGTAVNNLQSGRVDASVGNYQTGMTPLQPTTAGRTLDVTATGEAGIDWANIGGPTTSVNLSGTTISTSQAVASVSGNVGGNVVGSVASVSGNVGGNVVGSVASVTGAAGSVTGAVGSVTGNVGGNVVGSVASVTAAVATTSNIKKNQALANFRFLMTDSTTHNPATGKTVTVTRGIDNGAQAAGTLSAVTEIANGEYRVDFGAGDLNGNVIVLRATASGCDDTFERIVTQP
jgi:hypothetical protein